MILEETITWIPTAERTPDTSELVMGFRQEWIDDQDQDPDSGVDFVWFDGQLWHDNQGGTLYSNELTDDPHEKAPTHWAPRPSGPREGVEASYPSDLREESK